MVERVAQFMKSHGLLEKGQHVVVACSGGADSLALLDVLLALQKAWQIAITVAHFEHGIRGEEALADAAFVESFARARGVPFRLGSADVPRLAREAGMSLELAARKARYAFLWDTVSEAGADALATAHHADDQAETVLMRILRGTGTEGLAAMRARSGRLVRPLLAVTRREIESYCAARDLSPRHDATNDCADCTRNALRLEILPYLRRLANPAVSRALCQLADVAAAESDCLEDLLDTAWEGLSAGEGKLLRAPFLALPLALQRRALRRLWREAREEQDLAFSHVEALRTLFVIGETGSEQSLPHGRQARVSYGRLQILPQGPAAKGALPPPARVRVPGVTEWGTWRLTARVLPAPPAAAKPNEFYFAAPPPASLCLRGRAAGDYIQLAAGRKKLKDVLIDDKIPREERAGLPLLASGGEVLWIAGRRRSAAYSPKGKGSVVYCRIESREDDDHDG